MVLAMTWSVRFSPDGAPVEVYNVEVFASRASRVSFQMTGAGQDVLLRGAVGRDEVEFTVDVRDDAVWEVLGQVTGAGAVALLSPERLTRVVHVDRRVGEASEDLPDGRRQVVAVRVRGVVVGILPPGS